MLIVRLSWHLTCTSVDTKVHEGVRVLRLHSKEKQFYRCFSCSTCSPQVTRLQLLLVDEFGFCSLSSRLPFSVYFTVWVESRFCCTTQFVCDELPALHSCLPGLCHTQGYSKQAPWFSLFSDPQTSSVLYSRSPISVGTNHCSLSHTEWFCHSRVIVSQLDVSVGKHYRFVFRAKVTRFYTKASGFQPGFSFLSPAGKPCGWSWVKLALFWCVTSSPLDFQLPGLCCFEFLWVLEALLFLFGIVSLIFLFSFPQSLGPCSSFQCAILPGPGLNSIQM